MYVLSSAFVFFPFTLVFGCLFRLWVPPKGIPQVLLLRICGHCRRLLKFLCSHHQFFLQSQTSVFFLKKEINEKMWSFLFGTFSFLLKLWIIGRWKMKRHEDESCAVFLLVQKWKTRCIFGGKNNPEYDCYIAIKSPLSFFQFLIWIMWSRNLVGIWHRRFNWIIKT